MEKPWGVAVNQRGQVVVTERDNCCVSVFDVNGEKRLSFGSRGSGQGEFERPSGVTVDGEGNIYVADAGNNSIQKFTPEGQFLMSVGVSSSTVGSLRSVQFNRFNGRLYITKGHYVEILDTDLTFWNSFELQECEYSTAYDVCCDSAGKVYIADCSNHRVQVFTAEGKFLGIFGEPGKEKGQLFCPYCLALDDWSNQLYISELGAHRVSIFNAIGMYDTSVGTEQGKMLSPRGLCVDCGVMYVCDSGNNCVQIF